MTLQLEPTPDLLAGLNSRADQTVIGFALEPKDRMISSAGEKLARKHLHAIVANPLETMDSTNVTAEVLLRDGTILQPNADLSKEEFARWLLDHLPEIVACG